MLVRGLIMLMALCLSTNFANAQKTGEYILDATPADILASDAADYSNYISANETLSWEVYVPENYDPAKPAGIMVYAGAPRDVRPPVGWLSVMADKNLIWVAARKSGNGSSIYQKELLAMMSVPLIEKDYNIDKSRVYITGQGRTAARTALKFSNIFTGGIFIGNRLWEDNADDKVKNILDKRYVFVTREKSAEPKGNRYAFNKFRSAGVAGAKLELLQKNHRYNRPKFANSIDYLDG